MSRLIPRTVGPPTDRIGPHRKLRDGFIERRLVAGPPADRVGPHGKHRDGVIERRLVAGPGLQAGDAVCQVMRHAQFVGDVKLQFAQAQAPACQAGVPRTLDIADSPQAVVVGAHVEAVTLEVAAELE